MSKDLKIKHKCPHHVVSEWLRIDADFRTLRTVRFPSSREIRLLCNGVTIPPTGLYSNINITSLRRGPFSFSPNHDMLAFSVNDVLTSITFPHRTLSASQVAQIINEESADLSATSKRGRVTLTLNFPEEHKALHMLGGSGHDILGFSARRIYRAERVFPGWSLVKNKDRGDDPLSRIILFDAPLQRDDDIFEVSYHTLRSVCRRCMGTGVENDFRFDHKGDPVLITGTALMLQEVEKIVFTTKGSNVFHRWYGTSINDLIGSKIVGGSDIVQTQLVSQISQTIETYRQLKERQALSQPVSRDELLQSVVSISVEQGRDPSMFSIDIKLQSRSGRTISLEDEIVISGARYGGSFNFVQ